MEDALAMMELSAEVTAGLSAAADVDAARIGEMMLERVARWQREGCTAYCLPVVSGDLLVEAERVLRIRSEASNQYGGSQRAESTTEKQL
jgi:hypothetical protein